MSTQEQTYTIPEDNMERLNLAIAKINRRAEKIGCSALRVEILNTFQKLAPGHEEAVKQFGSPADFYPMVVYNEVAIRGEAPKINGWKFVGTLDHFSIPGSVIVKTVPGQVVPSEFHNSSCLCSHCNKIRRRTETFVLEGVDENVGQWKQVGRKCLKDFFGHDPSRVANWLTYIMDFVDELSGEEWSSPSVRVQYVFNHITVLIATAAIIRETGWVPRSVSNENKIATADLVRDTFFPPRHKEAYEHWRKWMDGLDINNELNTKDAIAAREWLKTQPNNNEYMHNLHTIDKAEAVPTNMFGFWCSVMAAYYRSEDRLRLQSSSKKVNDHFGNVGDKVEINVKVVGYRAIDGAYGTVRIFNMLSEDGYTFVWFANNKPNMTQGGGYKIKGSIKGHDKYNDRKQTILTRVKVLEEIKSDC